MLSRVAWLKRRFLSRPFDGVTRNGQFWTKPGLARQFVLLCCISLGLGIGPASPIVSGAEQFEFRAGDRVVFLGDTFFERESDYGSIEMRLTAAFPERSIVFRNLLR